METREWGEGGHRNRRGACQRGRRINRGGSAWKWGRECHFRENGAVMGREGGVQGWAGPANRKGSHMGAGDAQTRGEGSTKVGGTGKWAVQKQGL